MLAEMLQVTASISGDSFLSQSQPASQEPEGQNQTDRNDRFALQLECRKNQSELPTLEPVARTENRDETVNCAFVDEELRLLMKTQVQCVDFYFDGDKGPRLSMDLSSGETITIGY